MNKLNQHVPNFHRIEHVHSLVLGQWYLTSAALVLDGYMACGFQN
jgi:hypothetical protein